MCLMKLPIPTSLVDQSHLTMETMGCFTIEQLYQWRFVTVYISLTIGIFRLID